MCHCDIQNTRNNFARGMTLVPYGCENQSLAYDTHVKYYLLGAFPENLIKLSSLLTNILRLEARYKIRFRMLRQEER